MVIILLGFFFFFRKRNSNKPELEVSLISIYFMFFNLVFNFVKSAKS